MFIYLTHNFISVMKWGGFDKTYFPHTVVLPGIKYIASEGCAFQSDFEEWGTSACAAMYRSDRQLAGIVSFISMKVFRLKKKNPKQPKKSN